MYVDTLFTEWPTTALCFINIINKVSLLSQPVSQSHYVGDREIYGVQHHERAQRVTHSLEALDEGSGTEV